MTRTSSLSERPGHHGPRRLVHWLNPAGERKVHSLVERAGSFLEPSMRHLCESGLRENRTSRLSGGRRPAPRGASSDPTAVKSANKGMRVPAESMERRTGANGRSTGQSTYRTLCRVSRDTGGLRATQACETARLPRVRLTFDRRQEPCALTRPHGSVRGAPGNRRPYRDWDQSSRH